MEITPTTKVVGLIGHPIAHSLSPVIHNHLYRSLGLDMVYHAFDVRPNQVEEAVKGFKALGFLGFNVTVPYKETIFKLLEHIDNEAKIIGAVNTIKIDNGKLIGYNTDGQGFLQSLGQSGFSVYGTKVVILGAGGSARAIGVAIAGENPESITIVNRTVQRAKVLAEMINQYKNKNLARVVASIPRDADIIINTTRLGMLPNTEENPLKDYSLNEDTFICDIVYNPRETAMLQYAKLQSCKTMGGFGMLIGQGLRAIEIWLDESLPSSAWQIMTDATNQSE
jgi:shikimate dehydrogenase